MRRGREGVKAHKQNGDSGVAWFFEWRMSGVWGALKATKPSKKRWDCLAVRLFGRREGEVRSKQAGQRKWGSLSAELMCSAFTLHVYPTSPLKQYEIIAFAAGPRKPNKNNMMHRKHC